MSRWAQVDTSWYARSRRKGLHVHAVGPDGRAACSRRILLVLDASAPKQQWPTTALCQTCLRVEVPEPAIPEPTCACAKCVSMCKTFPCRPLPSEVTAMPPEVQARLMISSYGRNLSKIPHLQAGTFPNDGGEIPDAPSIWERAEKQRCVFLTQENKCELHGTCKPFEGRASHHTLDTDPKFKPITDRLKREWHSPEGRAVIERWREQYNPSTLRLEYPENLT